MTRRFTPSLACAGLLLAACGAESDPPATTTPDAGVPRPSEYVRPEDPPPTSKLSEAELADAIKAGMKSAMRLENQVIFDTYSAILGTAEQNVCPAMTITNAPGTVNTFWQGDCSTFGGSTFQGFGSAVTLTNAYGEDGAITNGWYIFHSGKVTSPNGRVVDGAGTAVNAWASAQNDAFRYFVREVHGTFLVSNGANNPWSDGTRRVDLNVTAAYIPSTTGKILRFAGGLSGLSGKVDSIAFDGVDIATLLAGSKCTKEPSGTISLRDESGQWYDVVFDGPVFDGPEPDLSLCDGCGRAFFRGQSIGEVCVSSFADLFTWGESPW